MKPCASRGDCAIGVGFDLSNGTVVRFLVDLQYTVSREPRRITQIARIDHNPANPAGHDIRVEGLHVDAVRKDGSQKKFWPTVSRRPGEMGVVIKTSTEYLDDNADFLVDFYEDNHRPPGPPGWPP